MGTPCPSGSPSSSAWKEQFPGQTTRAHQKGAPGPRCCPAAPRWERGSLSPVFGGSCWELDVTQLPWDAETRAAHFHAIPIPRHSQKCLEEGFSLSLSSRDGQLGNLLFFISFPEVSPGLLSKQNNPPLPPFLPAHGQQWETSPCLLPLGITLCCKGGLVVPHSPPEPLISSWAVFCLVGSGTITP